MAKEKVNSFDKEVTCKETVEELVDIQNTIDKIVKSPEYDKLMKYSQKLQKIINDDNEKMEKEGKSSFTYEQKQALVSQGCALAALDFSVVTVGNITNLRHHIEDMTLQCLVFNNHKRDVKKEAESKK